MEIQPANVDQVRHMRDGRLVLIESDVGGVAQQLREIDKSLVLRYSESGDFYVVFQRHERGDGTFHEEIVTTSLTCDGRLVKRVLFLASEDYDYGAELDRLDAEKHAAADHRLHERVGELGERLAHALRKDLGIKKPQIYVPGG